MHFGSSLRHSSHLHIHVHVCGLFTLILPFYFLLYLPPLFLFLNYMKSMVNLHNSCNEGVDASDDLLLSTRRIEKHSSQSTGKTAKRTTIRGHRRIRLRSWPKIGWSFHKVKPADSFVRVAGQPADSFVIVVNVGPNPVEDEQLEFSAFFMPWRMVIFPRFRTGYGCLENLQTTDGECEQCTHKYSTCRVAHSIITFHHANTRGSRAARLRIAHLCVPKTIVIHVSCLIPCRTWHWPQAQVLSHPFHPLFLFFRRSHQHTQNLWSSTHIYPAMFRGRVADQHKSHLSHFMTDSCPRDISCIIYPSFEERIFIFLINALCRFHAAVHILTPRWETGGRG